MGDKNTDCATRGRGIQFGLRQLAGHELRLSVNNGHGFIPLGKWSRGWSSNRNLPVLDLLWSPLLCPFKSFFLRKAGTQSDKHGSQKPGPFLPPVLCSLNGGPESTGVSFYVFSPVKTAVLSQCGSGEGSHNDRSRPWAGHCTDTMDPFKKGYPRLPCVQW